MITAQRTGHAALDISPPLSITAAHTNRCAARQMSIVAKRIAKNYAGVDHHVDRDIQGRVVRSPSPA
jgi:hypothetical protein